MTKYILLVIALLGSMKFINAQDTGLSFEVQYPILFSDEKNAYPINNGVLGGSLQYQFTDNIPFNFGVEYKFDFFQSHKGTYNGTKILPVSFLYSNFNLFGKFLFIDIPEMQLYATGGFTTYKYSTGLSRSFLGFNTGAGLTYDIFDQIYASTSFSYIKATRKSLNNSYKETEKNMLLRVGLGFKF